MVEGISRVRHYGGFVLAGVVAMCVDAGILEVLTRGLGSSPFIGRPLSIFVAMVVSWAINRWVAFAVAEPPTWREFGKFAAACTLSISVNYIVFAAILLAFPATPYVRGDRICQHGLDVRVLYWISLRRLPRCHSPP